MGSGRNLLFHLKSGFCEKFDGGILVNHVLGMRTYLRKQSRPIDEKHGASLLQNPFDFAYEALLVFNHKKDVGGDDAIDASFLYFRSADFLKVAGNSFDVSDVISAGFVSKSVEQVFLDIDGVNLARRRHCPAGFDGIKSGARAEVCDNHAVGKPELFDILLWIAKHEVNYRTL